MTVSTPTAVPPQRRRALAAATFGAAALLAACSGNSAPATQPPPPPPPVASCTFANPLSPGADPAVVRRGADYFLVQSSGRGITVFRAATLTDLLSTSGARTSQRVWTAPDTGWNQGNVWAPELHQIGGRWYIYYAAGPTGPSDAPFINQRSFVLESTGADPLGPYVDRGMLYTGDDVAARTDPKWAIDLTVQTIGGQLYAVWSGWERNTTIARTPQHLYIARMASPTAVASNRVRISSPDAAFERREDTNGGLDLQEGPEFLTRNGQTFIIYSTRESWLPAYRLGQLRLREGADPMDPASYVKTGPVFQAAGNVYGPGHHTTTTSPDSSEHWIVYHAKTLSSPGWNDRVIRMQKFTWNADGSPNFGTPVAPGIAVARPSGECR